MTQRDLFGGAISADIEGRFLDASDLRQVPDNQEVLLGVDDETTVIVEVLESVAEGKAKDNLEEAIRFHFSSLAHDNAASSSTVLRVFPSSPEGENLQDGDETPSPLLLIGEQKIKKFGKEQEPEDQVRIYLALWRLTPRKNVDLIMSINEPLKSPASIEPSAQLESAFHKAARSLRIKDWNLFAA